LANAFASDQYEPGGTLFQGVPLVARHGIQIPYSDLTAALGTGSRVFLWLGGSVEGIVQSFVQASEQGRVPVGARCPEDWDGSASTHIADALQN